MCLLSENPAKSSALGPVLTGHKTLHRPLTVRSWYSRPPLVRHWSGHYCWDRFCYPREHDRMSDSSSSTAPWLFHYYIITGGRNISSGSSFTNLTTAAPSLLLTSRAESKFVRRFSWNIFPERRRRVRCYLQKNRVARWKFYVVAAPLLKFCMWFTKCQSSRLNLVFSLKNFIPIEIGPIPCCFVSAGFPYCMRGFH